MEKKQNLNIFCYGFDWEGLGRGNYKVTKAKFDRDGLGTAVNNFLVLYAGFKNSREAICSNFRVWHLNLQLKFRILYDLIFVFLTPAILLIEREKPDLFYLYDFVHIFSAFLPAKMTRAKIYMRLINLPTELALTKGARGKILFWYYKIIEKMTFRAVDKFIVINQTTHDYLIKLGVREEKIIFDIPDTIETDQNLIRWADKERIRRDYKLPEDKKIIISIGSLIKEKGFFELIKAFKEISRNDLALVICGKGKEEENLRRLSHELGISDKIIFAGHVDRQTIWDYLSGSDLFMLFSKSEALGMVFWEAMYSEVPVIGTKVGGVKETVGEDGARGFYWQGDTVDLNKKINFCLTDSQEKETMIKNAKQFVRERLTSKKKINEIFE